MINKLNLTNSTTQRIPTDSVYNIILTLILAFGIVWVIYSLTSYSHYSLYLIETQKK
jgi:uncharacterized membrane protein